MNFENIDEHKTKVEAIDNQLFSFLHDEEVG